MGRPHPPEICRHAVQGTSEGRISIPLTFRAIGRCALPYACALLAALLPGCGGKQMPSTIVARVGDSQLTLAEARQHIDTTRADAADQVRRYIGVWVADELLYQEAKRKGVDRSELVQRRIDDAQRELVVQQYLHESLYRDGETVPEDSLRGYFTRHAAEFFVHEDMISANIALFAAREKASAFAAAIAQGTPWAAVMRDSSLTAGMASASSGQFQTVHTIVPPELWRVCQGLGPGEVSYPVKTDGGYVIVQVLKSYKQGAPETFEIARDEIAQRMMVEVRQRRYDSLLASLRGGGQVQVNSSFTASDTAVHHE